MSLRNPNAIQATSVPPALQLVLDGFINGEFIEPAEIEALFKACLDNDQFNKLYTNAQALRIATLEDAKIIDEARIAVLEALGVNNPLSRFQMNWNGDKTGLNIAPGGIQVIPSLGQFDLIVPVGKKLILKNTRWGYGSTTANSKPTLQIQAVNAYIIPLTGVGVSTQVSPNFVLADNTAGSVALQQGVFIVLKNDATATANLVSITGIMSWFDLSIE